MTPEERAARERKQKIFVVVGGLFLVALLAFQLPKLLGGSSSPDAAAATTTEGSSVAGQPIVTPGTVTPVTPATPVSQTSKLTSLSVFSAKDPFIQQAVTPIPSGGDGAATAGKGGAGDAKGARAKPEATRSQSFTTGTPTSTATIVVVNGRRQALTSGQKFPASDPVFVLVAENPKAKTVSVGIAGGGYESGGATTTLKVGKPLELVNTATGARYRIKLLSVGSGEAQAAPEKSQAQP